MGPVGLVVILCVTRMVGRIVVLNSPALFKLQILCSRRLAITLVSVDVLFPAATKWPEMTKFVVLLGVSVAATLRRKVRQRLMWLASLNRRVSRWV